LVLGLLALAVAVDLHHQESTSDTVRTNIFFDAKEPGGRITLRRCLAVQRTRRKSFAGARDPIQMASDSKVEVVVEPALSAQHSHITKEARADLPTDPSNTQRYFTEMMLFDRDDQPT
jgi:hypothetical protein